MNATERSKFEKMSNQVLNAKLAMKSTTDEQKEVIRDILATREAQQKDSARIEAKKAKAAQSAKLKEDTAAIGETKLMKAKRIATEIAAEVAAEKEEKEKIKAKNKRIAEEAKAKLAAEKKADKEAAEKKAEKEAAKKKAETEKQKAEAKAEEEAKKKELMPIIGMPVVINISRKKGEDDMQAGTAIGVVMDKRVAMYLVRVKLADDKIAHKSLSADFGWAEEDKTVAEAYIEKLKGIEHRFGSVLRAEALFKQIEKLQTEYAKIKEEAEAYKQSDEYKELFCQPTKAEKKVNAVADELAEAIAKDVSIPKSEVPSDQDDSVPA